MKNEPSKDDFLDKLYAQKKHEQPPSELDEQIRARALEHVDVSRPSSLFKWQRVLSVAAVMVLSVYLFFDVNDFRREEASEALMDDYNLVVPSMRGVQNPSSANDSRELDPARPSVLMAEHGLSESASALPDELSSKGSEIAPRLNSQQFAVSSEAEPLERSRAKQEGDLISELVARESREVTSKKSSLNKSQAIAEALSGNAHSAESTLADIERHLAKGEIDSAGDLYQVLKERFPGFEVPDSVVESLRKNGEL